MLCYIMLSIQVDNSPRLYICVYVCAYIYIYTCMYVCMYVRMYVCMYVCMYVLRRDEEGRRAASHIDNLA